MAESIESEFELWIGRLAVHLEMPLKSVPLYLARDEIDNRQKSYPVLRSLLATKPLNLDHIGRALKDCWARAEQFDSIRLTAFVGRPESLSAISTLIEEFPVPVDEAVERIDSFIRACGPLGYDEQKTGRKNASSAALLASVILTAYFPRRFVDFRQRRWEGMAAELDYPLFVAESSSYGRKLLDAGEFALAISETPFFKEKWLIGEPLWTIAGISWNANSDQGASRPNGIKIDDVIYEEEFEEGRRYLRQHFIRERNRKVVAQAKEKWLRADPLLRCAVCGFSFVEVLGKRGEGYIEAHHTKPLSTLRAGERTRIRDLAKVCANCHRMLHAYGASVTIEELHSQRSGSSKIS